MALPFFGVQRVRITCPHCGADDTRLAAAVKKGMRTTCAHCQKRFVVEQVVPVIGTASAKRSKR